MDEARIRIAELTRALDESPEAQFDPAIGAELERARRVAGSVLARRARRHRRLPGPSHAVPRRRFVP